MFKNSQRLVRRAAVVTVVVAGLVAAAPASSLAAANWNPSISNGTLFLNPADPFVAAPLHIVKGGQTRDHGVKTDYFFYDSMVNATISNCVAEQLREPSGIYVSATRCYGFNKIQISGTQKLDYIDASGDPRQYPINGLLAPYDGELEVHAAGGEDTIIGGSGRNNLHGGLDRDFISGGKGTDYLYGDEERDTIRGAYLSGQDSKDYIYGGPGNDALKGGDGDDEIRGDDDDDSIWGDAGNDPVLDGGSGRDGIDGGKGNDTIVGGDGNDDLEYDMVNHLTGLRGGDGEDVVKGGNNDDLIYGGGDADPQLEGEQGNDTIKGGDGEDTIRGGDGDDTLRGEAYNDHIYGQNEPGDSNAGDDDIYGGDGEDWLYGNGGNDAIAGEAQNDRIWGGTDNDARKTRDPATPFSGLDGGSGDDEISGGAENFNSCDVDNIRGGTDNDHLYGDCGSDTIRGEIGEDFIYADREGDRGNDTSSLIGGPGPDHLFGGNGQDSMYGDDLTPDMLNSSNDELWGYGGIDNMKGGYFDDTLRGGDELPQGGQPAAGDTMDGGNGGDHVWGGEGEDWVRGGPDVDDLHGEGGNDYVSAWDVTCSGSMTYPKNGMPDDIEQMGTMSAGEMKGSCKGGSKDTISCGSGNDSGWVADWNDDIDPATTDCETPLHAAAYFEQGELRIEGGTSGGGNDLDHGVPAQHNDWTVSGNSDRTERIYDHEHYYMYVKPGGGCSYKGSKRYDIICNTATSVRVVGEWGDDEVGTSRFDRYVSRSMLAEGGPGDDTLDGGNGRDVIFGGIGDDKIDGKGDTDYLQGESDNDTIIGGEGFDNVDGGPGADWLRMAEFVPQADTTIDCEGPNPPDTEFDTGSKPEKEDWADVDIFDAARVDNCENIAEPAPPPYAPPALDSSDV